MTHLARTYPDICSMKRLGAFLLPLNGILIHHKIIYFPTLNLQYPIKHLGGERHARVKCLALEHDAMQAQPWAAWSGDQYMQLHRNCVCFTNILQYHVPDLMCHYEIMVTWLTGEQHMSIPNRSFSGMVMWQIRLIWSCHADFGSTKHSSVIKG